MSILETFYILFKSDASEVKKGAEEAEKSTKRLNETLNNTGKASEKVGAAFLGMARAFTGVIAAAVSASTVIAGIRSATEYSQQLAVISQQLGVNVTELDAWSNAVKRSGGSAEGFQSSLRNLSTHLGGSPAIALKVLPQLADVFSRLGRVRAFQYGKMLGLDESTILLLQHGRREVEDVIKRQKELGLVTKQDTELSLKFNRELTDTQTALRGVYLELSAAILPYLTKFLDLIIPVLQYLRQHIDLVKGAIIGIGALAAIMLAPFIAANAVVIAIAAGIAALIALFAIAYEDIKAFLAGNESLIGDILKKWPIVGKVVGGIIEYWRTMFNGLIETLKFVEGIFAKIFSYFKGDNKKLTVDIQNGQNLLGTAGASYLGSPTSNSILSQSAYNRNNAINTGPITINTKATDANGIAASLGRGIDEHTRYANSFFDDGVVA